MKYFKAISILLSTFFFLSCSPNKMKDQNNEIITLGIMVSMDYLPLAIAEREGYFAKHGIVVKFQKFLSANDRDIAIQSGSIDGAITDYTSAALLRSGGFDLKLTSKCQAPFYIVAGSQSGIHSLSDLKDKKIAVSRNTVIEFCVDMALQSAGIKDTDVEKVEINKIPMRLEMLRNNRIDVTGLPNPFGLIAQSEGCKLLTSMDSLGYTVTGIVFTQAAIGSKPDAIKKMYAAYNDGVEYLRSHSVEDISDILVKDLGFPQPLLSQVRIPIYTHAQAPSESDKDIKTVIKWLSDKNLVSSTLNISDLINDDLIKTE